MKSAPHPITKMLYRDEDLAVQEKSFGMHHTFYLWSVFKRVLEIVDLKLQHTGNDPVTTGAHWGVIKDPVTGLEYEVSIQPIKPKKK